MISFRSILSLVAVVSVTACAGTNTVATNSVGQEVDKAAPITSDNVALSKSEDAEDVGATRTETSVTPSSMVEQPTTTTTSESELASIEYEVTKIPGSFSAVTAAVESFVAEKNLNGAGLIVVDRDRGVRYHNHWGEFSTDRISLIASTSKVISAGVLVHLHDQGSLDLEAPIGDVVDYAGRLSNITSSQLLSGSSGIPGLRADDPLYICMFLPTSSLQQCAIEGLSVAASDPRTVSPDTEFRYGGIQLQIAGAVAEIASGKSWAELIDEIYVEPCDLRSLGYTNPWIPLGAISGSYPAWDGVLSLLPPTDNPHIGGGAYVTTGDYGKLLSMHLNGGKCNGQEVLSPGGVDLMQRNRSGETYGSPIGYGLGWWTQEIVGYGGSTAQPSDQKGVIRLRDPGLYGSTAWIQPEDGFAVYLVVESTSNVGNQLAQKLYPLVEAAVSVIND